MKPNRIHILALTQLAIATLFLGACASSDHEVATPTPARPPTATELAQKKLALLYLENAMNQLALVDDAKARSDGQLAIAHTYALLGEQREGRRILPPPPPLPHDNDSFSRYTNYLSIAAALGEYGLLEDSIERLDSRQAEDLIRGFEVYYDAVLQRPHLKQSLKEAADSIDQHSAPQTLFYLAFGYRQSGLPDKARQVCLIREDPPARFVACAYMAEAMAQYGQAEEMEFYMDEAQRALALIPDPASVDPFTQMLHGRALALAGRVDEAVVVYTRLTGTIDAMHVGTALVHSLKKIGRTRGATSIIRDVDARFEALKTISTHPGYLYASYGDFLVTLERYKEYNAELKRTSNALLKAHLFMGGAEALADELRFVK